MSDIHKVTGGAEKIVLTVAICGVSEEHRNEVVDTFASYSGLRLTEFPLLPSNDEVATLAQNFNVIILDVDSDPNWAYGLAERIVADGRAYVMAFSTATDMKLAIRFMRAGVREFFTLPFDTSEVTAALFRATEFQAAARVPDRAAGKLFVFLGTKGGCGVTTLAANFALALAQESDQSTLLIDLGLPLGDVAINLGMKTEYSVANALHDADRLDSNFLKTLVANYSNGLDVLAAPSDFREIPRVKESIDRLALVARHSYDHVVVDAGSRAELVNTALFEKATTVYLITQVGISELRNANRMIMQFFASRKEDLQIVLNRYTAKTLLFDDSQITKTLTRPAQWKVPDDYAAARRTRNTATPMVLTESSISQTIREMARSAAGIATEKDGKRGLFRLLR